MLLSFFNSIGQKEPRQSVAGASGWPRTAEALLPTNINRRESNRRMISAMLRSTMEEEIGDGNVFHEHDFESGTQSASNLREEFRWGACLARRHHVCGPAGRSAGGCAGRGQADCAMDVVDPTLMTLIEADGNPLYS